MASKGLPRSFWIVLLLLGIVLVLVEQGVSLSDLGIVLIVAGGGGWLWHARRRGSGGDG